jgi:hypothetical protein
MNLSAQSVGSSAAGELGKRHAQLANTRRLA